MISAAALAAIAAAISGHHVREHSFLHGDETTLLLFRPVATRSYAAASAYAVLREQGLHLVGGRTLTDGRVAIEFARRPVPRRGIAALCHENSALPVSTLAAAGWPI